MHSHWRYAQRGQSWLTNQSKFIEIYISLSLSTDIKQMPDACGESKMATFLSQTNMKLFVRKCQIFSLGKVSNQIQSSVALLQAKVDKYSRKTLAVSFMRSVIVPLQYHISDSYVGHDGSSYHIINDGCPPACLPPSSSYQHQECFTPLAPLLINPVFVHTFQHLQDIVIVKHIRESIPPIIKRLLTVVRSKYLATEWKLK